MVCTIALKPILSGSDIGRVVDESMIREIMLLTFRM